MPPAGIHDPESERIDPPVRRSSSVIRSRKPKAALGSVASAIAAYGTIEPENCGCNATSRVRSDAALGKNLRGAVRRVNSAAASAAPKQANDFGRLRSCEKTTGLTTISDRHNPIPPDHPN